MRCGLVHRRLRFVLEINAQIDSTKLFSRSFWSPAKEQRTVLEVLDKFSSQAFLF